MGCFFSAPSQQQREERDPFANVVAEKLEDNTKSMRVEIIEDAVAFSKVKYAIPTELNARKLKVKIEPNSHGKPGLQDLIVQKQYKLPEYTLPQSNVESVSMTIIAGFDPTGLGLKFDCQDDCDFDIRVDDDIICAVFDGHGEKGRFAAHFCATSYLRILTENPCFKSDPVRALKETFLKLDADLCKQEIFDVTVSGTTAVVSLIRDGHVYVANCGDSRAVLFSGPPGKLRSEPLSTDHKCDTPAEAARIEKAGGKVDRIHDSVGRTYGPLRIFSPGEDGPGLAMSRSLGDSFAHGLGCSAEADVQIIPLSLDDQFLILASDGVWEFLTNEKVTKVLDHSLVEIQNAQPPEKNTTNKKKKNKQKTSKRDVLSIRQNEAEIDWSRLLARSARDRWIKENQISIGVVDDVSCVVVRLQVQSPGKIDLPDGTPYQGATIRKSMAIPPPPSTAPPATPKQVTSRDSLKSFPSMPPISSTHESGVEPNF